VNEAPRLCSSCSHWDPYPGDEPPDLHEGRCRRFPPAGLTPAGAGPVRAAGTGWPWTLDRDWCGEWALRQEFTLGEEEEKELRNAAMAQALLALSEETRDQLLSEVLSDDEMACPAPPEDFYERVQNYFALRKEEG
jgi:hypothetical protein